MGKFYLSGFTVGLSLLAAIGVQNAYVLKQAVLGIHVKLIITLCMVIDALLITLGVMGMSKLVQSYPQLLMAIRYIGVVFLLAYGSRLFLLAARNRSQLQIDEGARQSASSVVLTVLALSLLNPHTYLDTVVLLGGVGSQYPWPGNAWFVAGATTSSVVWFLSLGVAAKQLRALFAYPLTWKILDTLTGLIMWGIAASLIWFH